MKDITKTKTCYKQRLQLHCANMINYKKLDFKVNIKTLSGTSCLFFQTDSKISF